MQAFLPWHYEMEVVLSLFAAVNDWILTIN